MACELEKFFTMVWEHWMDDTVDGADLQDAMVEAGLAQWREATQADIDSGDWSVDEVGDRMIELTDAGKAAQRAVHGPRTGA